MNTQTLSYEEQATKFLAEANSTLKFLFDGHRPYFPNDEESRDVWKFTIKTKLGSHTGTFGQSIANSKKGMHPTAYDVLTSVTKNDPGTFDNFCGDFGYDTDSRNAEKTWKAVKKEWKGISHIFTEEQIDALQEIQ